MNWQILEITAIIIFVLWVIDIIKRIFFKADEDTGYFEKWR